MAICYDFDKTLSPDDMQSFTLIPSFGMCKEDFWPESNQLAKENLMDNNLAWMYQLLVKSKACRKSIRRDYFREAGQHVELYKGVDTWFQRVNRYAGQRKICPAFSAYVKTIRRWRKKKLKKSLKGT